MKSNNISIVENCANCGSCYNVCSKGAITITTNEIFYKPRVNNDLCINCGVCLKNCPLNNEIKKQKIISAFCGSHKNKAIINQSSSGGAFSAIANFVISQNGVVYGAVFGEDKHSVIFGSSNSFSLDDLRRSKYVESISTFEFSNIKRDLEAAKLVLFCGTPCQVAGLLSYLNKPCDNLITIDFVCGGLPSHQLYDSYLNNLEEKYASKVKSVNFRPKLYGWSNHAIYIKFENGKKYKKLALFDPYFYAFVHKKFSIRNNCLECKFRNNHYADIIIADFWKYRDVPCFKANESGLSLLMANSIKGDSVIRSLKEDMNLMELDIDKVLYNFKNNIRPDASYYEAREKFWEEFSSHGIEFAAKNSGMSGGAKAKWWTLKTWLKYQKDKR